MRRNILLKKRIGCLLAAALLAGEIGSASMVAIAAPVTKTQTCVENQVENQVENISEECITFGENVGTESNLQVEELDAAKESVQIVESGVSDPVDVYETISVNDVISEKEHTDVSRSFSFTPETSGYYGFYSSNMSYCNIWVKIYSGEWERVFTLMDDAYYCYNLEAGKTYNIQLDKTIYQDDYTYEAKWVSFDYIDLPNEEIEITCKQTTIFDIGDKNGLYSIKVESENDYTYELAEMERTGKVLELSSGEEAAFFYHNYDNNKLILKKNGDLEDRVKVTIKKVPVSTCDLGNVTQELHQYKAGDLEDNTYPELFTE